MTTHVSTRHDMRGWPEARVARRAITFAELSVAGVVLLVVSFALGIVEPADRYTDSWPQPVWGLGIWECAVVAFITGLVAIVRHRQRLTLLLLGYDATRVWPVSGVPMSASRPGRSSTRRSPFGRTVDS